MNTVSIFPIASPGGPTEFHAVAGQVRSTGSTAGKALDALSEQLTPSEFNTLVVVQHMQPDELFTQQQQQRLGELMQRWRDARDGEGSISDEEQSELARLIDLELDASGRRAAKIEADLRP